MSKHRKTPEAGTFAADMRDQIAVRWAAVFDALPAAIAGIDPEGVHDVRVASRRLRAAMDVAIDCFPEKWFRPLHRAARDITAELGAVRDRDVLLEALAAERAGAPPEDWPGIDRLIERIDRERTTARATMLTFLGNFEASGLPRDVRKRFGPSALGHLSRKEPR